MMPDYHILYRGPLSSCNYGCTYCPFAKRDETYAQLEGDRQSLERFVSWIELQDRSLSILFTPWGEALVRTWYQQAITRLSWMPHVRRVAIQTNLASRLAWLEDCQPERIGLWSTFHPTETSIERFGNQVLKVLQSGTRISVGCVGLKEHFDLIEQLREAIPREVYVWINAYKREANYYSPADVERLIAVDPHFVTNNTRHESFGEACFAGETSFTVDGEGDIRRCHFVGDVIGSIEDADWENCLHARRCPNTNCGCHIGYVHLKRLQLYPLYQEGLAERIPADWSPSRKARST
ncbi:STM4011 family radical SAM protein [Bremerella sp. JC817]|uniref:STM4011 family radical SAM protein n=1 Tax=Bremerella sp. JC817 TaxID=3231756 RepID=UPI003457A374